MTDPIRSALKRLLSAVLDGLGQDDHPMGWARVDDAIDAARAALPQPVPEVVEPSLEEVEDLCEEHCFNVEGYESIECLQGLINEAITRWGRPAPAPAEGEVAELVALIRQIALTWEPDEWLLGNMTAGQLARAADLLERRQTAPAPVPVGERSDQIEDLAADAVGALRYIEQSHGRLYGVGWDRVYEKADRLQPHALPLPSGEVK